LLLLLMPLLWEQLVGGTAVKGCDDIQTHWHHLGTRSSTLMNHTRQSPVAFIFSFILSVPPFPPHLTLPHGAYQFARDDDGAYYAIQTIISLAFYGVCEAELPTFDMLRSSGSTRHGLRNLAPQMSPIYSPTVIHTGQESGGELCGIFKFW